MTNDNIMKKFKYWLCNAKADIDLVRELKKVEKKLEQASEAVLNEIANDLEDRFYCELEFGTGGLRGIIGAGTNRINYYTVARATQGLADFVKMYKKSGASVAIAFDSRRKSQYFARIAAQVLAANDIKCYVRCHNASDLLPTPILSYAVRRLKCDAGIMITASHNPAQYNGYKAYGSDGCQLSPSDSEAVEHHINTLDLFKDVVVADFDEAFDKGLITRIDDDVLNDYYAQVKKQSVHPGICKGSGLKVVFTPLNGAGNKPVRKILRETGVDDVIVVPEQELPDGSFPTCPYPNPEFKEALELGIRLASSEGADLLLATDPDCDRVGIAVRDRSGKYALFTGNEVGALLLEYICRERRATNTMPLNPVAVKSIVSTAIAEKIANKYDVQMIDVLTGFKFIGAIAGKLEKQGEQNRFIYGFEESIGYMSGSYVRDKDAVCACMLICEMAAFYKNKGMSLIEARKQMYEDYGYYYNYTQNIKFEGVSGLDKMRSIMDSLRNNTPSTLCGLDVVCVTDYLAKTVTRSGGFGNATSDTGLPKSNVMKLELSDDSVIIVRPSGTEPKLKIYYTSIGDTQKDSIRSQEIIMKEFSALIGV